MSRTIQRYQQEFGLAIARELQRNQERSRRGRTPLEPSLGQNEARSLADASAKSNQAQLNAEYNGRNDAQWRADNSYYAGVNYSNQVNANANAYTNQQVGSHGVPYAAEMMWIGSNPVPAGWINTGRTVQLERANSRIVIRKVV